MISILCLWRGRLSAVWSDIILAICGIDFRLAVVFDFFPWCSVVRHHTSDISHRFMLMNHVASPRFPH